MARHCKSVVEDAGANVTKLAQDVVCKKDRAAEEVGACWLGARVGRQIGRQVGVGV